VPRARHVALEHHAALALHVGAHRRALGERVLAAEMRRDPLGLRIREGHDGAEGLEQPHEEEARNLGVKDPAEEGEIVVFGRHERGIEEGKGDLVTGAVDEHVGLLLAAVDEADPIARETLDVGSVVDRSVGHAIEDATADRRMCGSEAMIGRGQAVAREIADGRAEERLPEAPAHAERHTRVDEDGVERPAEQVLRHDPRAATGTEDDARGDVRGLDGDVHRAVAHAEHDDPLVREEAGLVVLVCVKNTAVEAPRKRRIRPARVPVVPVRDDDGVVRARLEARVAVHIERDGHVEAPVRPGLDAADLGLEGEARPHAEVIDVRVEVGCDLRVAREVRVITRHREIVELHALS
jgi:hypothetical protein